MTVSEQDYIPDTSYGRYGKAGKGNLRGREGTSRKDGSNSNKNTFGGGGGDYGQRGGMGYTFNKATTGIPFILEDDGSKGKEGGAGGKAIRIISSNSNYTVNNYRDKLLFITPSATPITDLPGLVGYFEAGNQSYNTGTTEATAGQTVEKWVSTNDDNVYLEQTVSDNKPTLQDADKEDTTVGPSTSPPATVRHAFFNNQKYIYFSPTLSTKINYMKLYGATSNADYDGDIQINNTGQSYAAGDGITIQIKPVSFSIAVGTVVNFEGGSIFRVTSAGTYVSPDNITELTGNLSGPDLHHNVRGYYRMSSLGTGFDIFYVIYPNRWLTKTGDPTFGVEGSNSQPLIDQYFQTGWSEFSSSRVAIPTLYNRNNRQVTDNTGLGRGQESFSFSDRGSELSVVGDYPRRAWVYNLSGSSQGGLLRITARNDGGEVGAGAYKGDNFVFNSSGSVYIGGSRNKGSALVDLGFRGGIAAIVIFNRHLTARENRKVLGVLFNKYLRTKAANAASQIGLEYQNKRSDLTGIAGQIYFTP